MNKKNLILVGVIAVILVLSFCYFWKAEGPSGPTSIESADGFHVDSLQETPPPLENKADAAPAAGFVATQTADSTLYESYKTQIVEMGKCLNLEVSAIDPNAEINFETLNVAISKDLGDVVAEEEDWSTTDIRTSSGEVRRILIQTPPPGEGGGERRLKYMSLSPDGKTKELPVSQDQTDNPSDTLLASLESDGKIVGSARARRVFYENGDDLYLSERNGKIYSFTLAHEGRIFRCKGMDAGKTVNCSCE